MKSEFEWTIPSDKDLKQFLGLEITNIIQTASYIEYIEYLESICLTGFKDKKSYFQFSGGTLIFIFSNKTEYMFNSAEDLNSIITCCKKKNRNELNIDSSHNTSILEVNDNDDFINLLNNKIVRINVLTRNNLSPKEQCTPSEVGLEFVFENEKKLILSHNLTENNFVFSILTINDLITDKIIVKQSLQFSS